MYQWNSFLFITFLALLTTLCQCKGDQPERTTPTIFANFEVRYLQGDRELRGQASFLQGDSLATATPISFEGGLGFMGSGTRTKQLPGAGFRYEGKLTADYPDELRFSFKRPGPNGHLADFNFPMEGIKDFNIQSANLKDGLRLNLEGQLERDESLLLLFTTPTQEARTIIRPGPISAGPLYIPQDALLHFEPGEYRLYLVKSKEIRGQMEDVQYQTIIEFYTSEKTVNLLKE